MKTKQQEKETESTSRKKGKDIKAQNAITQKADTQIARRWLSKNAFNEV